MRVRIPASLADVSGDDNRGCQAEILPVNPAVDKAKDNCAMTWASTPESGEYVGVSRFGFLY